MTIRHQPEGRPHYETRTIGRLIQLAEGRGWRVDVEPSTRFAARITLPDGRRHSIIGADPGLNNGAAQRLAGDKAFVHHFLTLDGIPCVPTHTATDAAHAVLTIALHAIEYPLIIKPNRSHEARGLSVVPCEAAVGAAMELARTIDPIALLQPFDPRPEFRVLLLGDRLICAFQKHRADPTAPANLASGGTWTDVTDDVHVEHRDLARRALRALGLTYGAVDLLATDIHSPALPGTGGPSILEVNATPGIKALGDVPGALDRLFAGVADCIQGSG